MPPQKASTISLFQNMPYPLQDNFSLNSLAISSLGKNVGHGVELSQIWNKNPKSQNFHKPSCFVMKIEVSKLSTADNLQTTFKKLH